MWLFVVEALVPSAYCFVSALDTSAATMLTASLSARAKRRVFGSADHSGADRTSDRAGAARE
ncbi:MAG: hypothetical protein DMF11_10955 [Verrucomicrobia bacterium]|nr:MAG: hypothetical protein DMF11_10955 [Verrucomicrobiota bacterium]